MLRYRKDLKERGRELRKSMTDAENLLWSRLRRKQVSQIPFYRQKPIGSYIVDFHAPAARLVIEVDGSQHYEPEARRKDRVRDEALRRLGLEVLRFDDRQVLCELESVVERIASAVESRIEMQKSPLAPLFQRGE